MFTVIIIPFILGWIFNFINLFSVPELIDAPWNSRSVERDIDIEAAELASSRFDVFITYTPRQ